MNRLDSLNADDCSIHVVVVVAAAAVAVVAFGRLPRLRLGRRLQLPGLEPSVEHADVGQREPLPVQLQPVRKDD